MTVRAILATLLVATLAGSCASPVSEPAAMPTDSTIDYIELPAADLEAAETFYATTFGWAFTWYGPDYVSFERSGVAGGFFASELRSTTAHGATLVVLYADDLEATRDRVVANGGALVKEIFDFPGGRRFHFTDPHGNELAVWSDR